MGLSQNPVSIGAGLTGNESKVARLLAEGLRREEIAQQLNVSISTVKFHLENVYRKLGVHNQVGAVAEFLGDPRVKDDGDLG
ncbi:MAG: helix-turn-helix transcriptional regulator [Bacteroidetes bacterium]|nr:helix-turn-helix transcriptional regulator [Bacteroidota bacterium]